MTDGVGWANPNISQMQKLEELRRAQRLATSLLAAMIAILAVSSIFERSCPWLHWIKAFAEAGAVGGLADLFAVTALFRHPFGIAIPHTAIIPANKQRIAENLGQFVEQQFLTRENIHNRLQRSNTAAALASWLDEPATQRMLSQLAVDLIPVVLGSIEEKDAGFFLKANIAPRLKKLDASRLAGDVLAALAINNKHQELFDRALRALERWLAANEGLVKAKFSQTSAFTPGFFDRYVAEKVIAGALVLLREVTENPQHALRTQFDQMTANLIERLETSEEFRVRGRQILRDTLAYLEDRDDYLAAWGKVKQSLLNTIETRAAETQKGVEGGLAALNEGVLKKPALQSKLNPWLVEALEHLVMRNRNQLPALISAVARGWDPVEVSRKIELEIGRDLQFIRINGTLVGGCAGLILHALANALA